MTEPTVRTAFEYFRDISALQERPSVAVMLRGLADQFDAASLGVCAGNDLAQNLLDEDRSGPPRKLPWQTDEKLLREIRVSLTAIAYHDPTGDWLIAAVMVPLRDERYFAWIVRPERKWSDAERWQWTYASHALVGWWLEEANPAADLALTQLRLESAAKVSARLIQEFGNLLTGMMGFTELAQVRAVADPVLTTYLQEVMLSAHQGADWLRRLHYFCQRGRGSIWPTHLPSLLQTMEARQQAQGRKQRWSIDAAADLPLLEIDALSLQAILQELIDNAGEATNDAGAAAIQARVKEMSPGEAQATLGALSPGACIEISVADEGPGFSAEARAKLFHELFYSSKRRHRGVGLLAVYGLLQRIQGGLALDFAATRGACARIYVPMAKLPVTSSASSKPAQVLLVHSDPTLLESMRSVLMAHGLRVSAVSAASAALSTVQLAKPAINLVVAETTMPRVSGFELARRMLDQNPKVQFLFLHSQSSYYDVAEEETLKRFVVLRWPVELVEFVKAVDHALANPAS